MATRIASTSASGPRLGRGPRTSVPSASAWSRDSASPAEVQVARLFSATVLGTGVDGHDNTLRRHPRKSVRIRPLRPSLVPPLTSFRAGGRALATETLYLPGTEVELRGLRWEVIDATPMGDQTLVRLRGTGGAFGGSEVDVLTPFEEVRPVVHQIDPTRPTHLANWLVFHQAFLLEQALGPNALLAVTPGRLRIEPYQLVPVSRCLRMARPRLLLADDVGLGKTIEAGLVITELVARRRASRILIVTPAGPLLDQWREEMAERFGLRLVVADRAELERIRKGTELGTNPFDHLPLALASTPRSRTAGAGCVRRSTGTSWSGGS